MKLFPLCFKNVLILKLDFQPFKRFREGNLKISISNGYIVAISSTTVNIHHSNEVDIDMMNHVIR